MNRSNQLGFRNKTMIINRIDSEFLRYLLTNGCEPGTRLPALDEISGEIGISTGKLREQFEVARMLGLVEASPRRGIRCLKYDFRPAVRLSLMVALALDPGAFRSFSTLRIHLETAFWEEAVALLNDEDKAHLHELVAQAQAKLNHERAQIPFAEHRAFHLGIFCKLENPFVLGLLEAYWDAYDAVELSTYADYRYLTEVWDYHQRIADALAREDYTAGKEALMQHMRLIDKLGVAHEISATSQQLQQLQGVAV